MSTPYYGVSGVPEYYRNIYGSGEVAWIPPVANYSYDTNVGYRGINDYEFRWEEVEIPLEHVQSGALLNFVMPDQYMLQVTPDIGWHDELSMFGENDDDHLHNPHLKNIGPLSIENGTLTDNGDNSVTISVDYTLIGSGNTLENYVSTSYKKHLWRAVPYANGNPALGGLPQSFEWVGQEEQIDFKITPIITEKSKMIQSIAGTKGSRVTVGYESEDNLDIIIKQENDTWILYFPINRSNANFIITATDSGGYVYRRSISLHYSHYKQESGHVWNPFDSFGLLAGLDRLPNEHNLSFKTRIADAFVRKGGPHYKGLIDGTTRELGLDKILDGIIIDINSYAYSPTALSTETITFEKFVELTFLDARVDIRGESFIIEEERQKLDEYNSRIVLTKRIANISQIITESGAEIPQSDYKLFVREGYTEGTEITINPKYSGTVLVTYSYYESLLYKDYKTLGELNVAINAIKNARDQQIVVAKLSSKLTGAEPTKYLTKVILLVDRRSLPGGTSVTWSPLGLNAISNHDWKWSFANTNNMFFSSSFYEYVKELKSKTNVEWGYVVADEDYWDAVDADWYGHDSLPFVFDVPISSYSTDVSSRFDSKKSIGTSLAPTANFDSLEAFRMAYTYNGERITNKGYSAKAFRSGVGYIKDCVTSVYETTLKASEENKVNLNPVVYNHKDIIDLPSDLVDNISFKL
jgi:hypothetical protein